MPVENVTNILPNVRIPKFQSQVLEFTGLDFSDNATSNITYCYNSRGFRDVEWPIDLTNAIWCIGDSFTTGIGSAFENTWPQVLGQRVQRRVINIGLDGASNNWISRKCCEIYNEIQPQNIVIMWSYLHRRESNRSGDDSDRRLWHIKSTVDQDFENFNECRRQLHNHCKNSNLIEMIIPNWQPAVTPRAWDKIRGHSWPESLPESIDQIPAAVRQELISIHGIEYRALELQYQGLGVVTIPQLDFARDQHHFDIVTANWVAAHVAQHLKA